jgi:signal transduction histidine kinase
MIAMPHASRAPDWSRLLAWPRIRFTLGLAVLVAIPLDLVINGGAPWYLWRTLAMGAAGLLAFGLFERWPERLPRPMARWAVQVLGVAAAMPLATAPIWIAANPTRQPFWTHEDQLLNFCMLTILGLLLAPWAALSALVRQKDALARRQALEFDLRRSELERRALDARLQLLRAQVAPHFLFNTLANVQALVDARSGRASAVLGSLIAYLRAATPRLDDAATTVAQELALARAYLELMHMRMPDRLAFTVEADEAALALRCPPMTLLTLTENAIRHGVDPSEAGGQIAIAVRRRAGRCLIRVADTGAGFQDATSGLGTGLASLRERLALSFAGDARLTLADNDPHGVVAEVDIPAQAAGAPRPATAG